MAIVLFMFLILFSKLEFITANGIGHSLTFKTNFEINEYSSFNDNYQNVNSINITLPSSSWSIQDIELNFTDIKFGKELKIIENQNYIDNYSRVHYQNPGDRNYGLGIQLKLNEPTTLYGVEFYGKKIERGPTTIDFQIRGYDAPNNKPNSSVYSSVEINVSITEGWHRQIFPSPILLSEGNYFLVINGSNVLTVNDDKIWWYYNNINPSDPSLYTSYYNETFQWSTGIQNHTYLHKLIQKVNTPVFPEEINMTVNIDDQFYEISNVSEGKGYLPRIEVDFSPNSDNYQIIVDNHASESLFFNVSFFVILTHKLFSPSSVAAQLDTANKWSVKPTITRQPTNYSILFKYPHSWENISVLRDEVNITLDVLHDTTECQIIILNESISNGADWEIIAFSPNIKFDLGVQKTDYILGQEIEFLLPASSLSGTYTFILFDPAGVPVQNQTIAYPSVTPFSYNLSLSDIEGNYTAYVFWFSDSETDASVQSQIFEISIDEPTPKPEFPLPLIVLIIILGAATMGLVSYIAYKKIHSQQRTKLEKFLNQCTDISNINEIIVIDSKSGIDLFSQSFGLRKVDTSLISGFLQAISNFGSTISESAKESRTLSIEYKDSIVMQTEFVNLKVIITLKENPSANFKFIMEDLAYDIYDQYGEEIDKFTGILKPFHDMSALIEKHLNVSFLYKLKIVENAKIKLSMSERNMVGKARTFMKENNFTYFYSLFLMPENTSSPKDYQTIFNLIEKGIFQPTDK